MPATQNSTPKYLLDTNIVNYLLNGDQNVIAHYEKVYQNCFISGITVEEILKDGYLAEINNIRSRRSKADLTLVYEGMFQAIRDLSRFNLSPYTPAMETILTGFRVAKLRGMDGRIAAHALELNYILVTENEEDFKGATGLVIENWRKPNP